MKHLFIDTMVKDGEYKGEGCPHDSFYSHNCVSEGKPKLATHFQKVATTDLDADDTNQKIVICHPAEQDDFKLKMKPFDWKEGDPEP